MIQFLPEDFYSRYFGIEPSIKKDYTKRLEQEMHINWWLIFLMVIVGIGGLPLWVWLAK